MEAQDIREFSFLANVIKEPEELSEEDHNKFDQEFGELIETLFAKYGIELEFINEYPEPTKESDE